MDKETLALQLFEIGAIKFGSFTLKSGQTSNLYLDLRLIISYPQLLRNISAWLWEKAEGLSFNLVCGVPYTALPLATCLSTAHNIPMILRRKEAKNYGTKKMVEGVFKPGQTCLIVEDVITTGSSILETCSSLRAEGLTITDALVIIDREQGARAQLALHGIKAHPLLKLSELVECLQAAGKVDREAFAQ